MDRSIYARLPKLYTRKWVDPVRRLREELGLPAGRNPLFEGQHSPGLVLALFSRILAAPQKDRPDRTVVTGFVTYDRDLHGEGIVEAHRFLEAGPPPIVFTLGSSAVFDAGIYIARARRRHPRLESGPSCWWQGPCPGHPTPSPRGLRCSPTLPIRRSFRGAPRWSIRRDRDRRAGDAGREAALAVYYGFDQPDNAARLAKLGMGKVVPAKSTPLTLAASLLREILEYPVYADRASSLGDRVRAEDGAGTACLAIERVLKGDPGDTSAMAPPNFRVIQGISIPVEESDLRAWVPFPLMILSRR